MDQGVDGTLTASVYRSIEEAREEAHAQLATSGGEVIVHESGRVVSISRVAPDNVVSLAGPRERAPDPAA